MIPVSDHPFWSLDTVVRDWTMMYIDKTGCSLRDAMRLAGRFDKANSIVSGDVEASRVQRKNAVAYLAQVIAAPSGHPKDVVTLAKAALSRGALVQ